MEKVEVAVADRESQVFNARTAEQAERYDEMVAFMKQVAAQPQELSVEERNLLSVAYKNSVGCRRASWRIISSMEQKEAARGDTDKEAIAANYRQKIEVEIEVICQEIIDTLDKYLILSALTSESAVFYNKMKGDYYRYIAEYTTGNQKEEAASNAHQAYDAATKCAEAELTPTHPIRLGLVLNYSVFHYEIMQDRAQALITAQTAFQQAIAQLDSLNEETYKDSTLIMQLLRDNLTLWESTAADEEGASELKD